MGRRRCSAPSSLILVPPTMPLIRGAPKFTIPSPPSNKVIHLAEQHRLKRFETNRTLSPLKDLPRLEFPVGVYGFSTTGHSPTSHFIRTEIDSATSDSYFQLQARYP
ncbi:hypothetical protein CROQUDRAFT_76726 [Cronartium quercuum f. sp. fusiforme G11]|uniref:Uncharacterized protein n=1 Tax=Cronartium quercuum f. sp. fusiforme G11 TaxID=708437 RepID=A0A9P6TCH5_9BASI|nr:hypothetical protein CROQUDRAFT_76726 [Cronartium quercuum f. sp. fusiforme G11]